MVKRISIILVIMITGVILVACVSTSTPKTSSVINDTSCSPPCWHNITPGITRRGEVKRLLEDIPWVDRESIREANIVQPKDSIEWSGKPDAADYSGEVYFRDDFATLINISPNEGGLLFTDLIEKLGEPEKVLAVYTKGERSIIAVYLLYPSMGYVFLDFFYASFDEPVKVASVRPDEVVKSVWYGEVNFVYDYLTAGQIDRLPMEFIEQAIQDWNGYGEYPYYEYPSEIGEQHHRTGDSQGRNFVDFPFKGT